MTHGEALWASREVGGSFRRMVICSSTRHRKYLHQSSVGWDPDEGVMIINQKFVDFLIGPSGQSLAAINYAAGVNIVLDQSHMWEGCARGD